MRNKLEFLNRNGEKFDWENDDLAEIEVQTVEEKRVQPDLITEIPGIPLESDYLKIQPPQTSNQVPKIPAAQRSAATRKKAGRDMQMTHKSRPEEWMKVMMARLLSMLPVRTTNRRLKMKMTIFQR